MATKRTLTFDEGAIEYEINGKATAVFNPSDADFIKRFHDTVEKLDARQDEMEADVEKAGDDPAAMYELLSSRDRAMRESIDGLLGQGVSDALFGDMNCYALAEGLPVWMNLILAIADEINENLDEEQAKADPRLQSYSRKYDDLMAKYKKAKPSRQLMAGN